MTADTLALAAQGYAALHKLTSITVMIDPDLHDVPAYLDTQNNTIAVQPNLPLEDFVTVVRAGVDAMCRATVVERDDGGGSEWATDLVVGGTHGPHATVTQGRPHLRLV